MSIFPRTPGHPTVALCGGAVCAWPGESATFLHSKSSNSKFMTFLQTCGCYLRVCSVYVHDGVWFVETFAVQGLQTLWSWLVEECVCMSVLASVMVQSVQKYRCKCCCIDSIFQCSE